MSLLWSGICTFLGFLAGIFLTCIFAINTIADLKKEIWRLKAARKAGRAK